MIIAFNSLRNRLCYACNIKSYLPLNAENCMQNVKKNQNIILAFFFHLDGKNAYISYILVYYSVKGLFLARLYESTESYCYAWALVSHFKVLRQSYSTTTGQKHFNLETLARHI